MCISFLAISYCLVTLKAAEVGSSVSFLVPIIDSFHGQYGIDLAAGFVNVQFKQMFRKNIVQPYKVFLFAYCSGK
jgi:hypothetical protein